MEIFQGHQAASGLRDPAIALGNFDGVHVGHQALLRRAADRAGGGDTVVYTFEPHPARVLAPKLAPPLLTSLDRKLELLDQAGASAVVVEPFTREFAGKSTSDFHAILKAMGAKYLVVGYDFTYGSKRSGSVETLRSFASEAGLGIDVVDAVDADGLVASSTKIREFIGEGNMPGAALLLGRPHEAQGVVIRGAGRGRTIGIPTANIAPGPELLPPAGVYAVRVERPAGEPSASLPGAANLGVNPTFQDDGRLSLEVHILDFDEDLYGQPLRIEFIERLRGEKRFSGPDQLIAQIHQDIAKAREILAT
ncbi:MAG: bifunctional riboflavin kinase/FAD synthetase [Deltaproteobacteria bacterium]|nr:bifunctional riboflavin kinase/FAD synthetase [Deltaproteobacteria bacterium]